MNPNEKFTPVNKQASIFLSRKARVETLQQALEIFASKLLRTAMKRTRLRRQAKGKFAAIERKLDKALAEYFKKRDGGICRIRLGGCLGTGTEPHHIFSRTKKSVRWEPVNSMLSCRRCHNTVHSFPGVYLDMFIRMARTKYGTIAVDALIHQANEPVPSPSMEWYKARLLRLQELTEIYNENRK